MWSIWVAGVCVFVCVSVVGGGDIPVFLCLSKQSKAVSGGNADKCRDDKHSSRIWGEHTQHWTDRVWRRLERNKGETGSSEGGKKTYRGWETGWGEVGNAKMPSGSSGKKLGSCLSNKSILLTVVLQLLSFFAPFEKHPVYDMKTFNKPLFHIFLPLHQITGSHVRQIFF